MVAVNNPQDVDGGGWVGQSGPGGKLVGLS